MEGGEGVVAEVQVREGAAGEGGCEGEEGGEGGVGWVNGEGLSQMDL